MECTIRETPFQFHSGSIKRRGNQQFSRSSHSFNSIVVRLKGHDEDAGDNAVHGFNSIVVRLKVDGRII